ncbi:MAG TPA: hypothetical protein VGJ13_05415 [Pseudonocardiaceae bacterium]|jgi:hypothetical protein
MPVIIGLLVLWVVCVVVGLAVKALFWLVILGVVAFAATAMVGALRHRHREG